LTTENVNCAVCLTFFHSFSHTMFVALFGRACACAEEEVWAADGGCPPGRGFGWTPHQARRGI
jgi:hypothetical protein